MGAVLNNTGERGTGAVTFEGIMNIGEGVGQRCHSIGHVNAGQIMRCQPNSQTLCPIKPCAGQRQKHADFPGQTRQIPAATDIGEQADPGFGHRKPCVFGGDTIGAGQGDPDAATHTDAVHDRDCRLGIGEQPVVHPVFGVEKRAGFAAVALSACRKHADVTAGAKTAALCVVENNGLNGVISFEDCQRFDNAKAHIGGQRVECRRAIEPDATNPALFGDDQVGGHCRNKSRPMIIRITWFVPSRIEWTRRSRQKRSIG